MSSARTGQPLFLDVCLSNLGSPNPTWLTVRLWESWSKISGRPEIPLPSIWSYLGAYRANCELLLAF